MLLADLERPRIAKSIKLDLDAPNFKRQEQFS